MIGSAAEGQAVARRPAASRLARGLPALALIGAALAVYAGTLGNGFVDDDRFQVLGNPWIRDARRLPEIFTSGVWSFLDAGALSNYYRPMMHVIYMAAWHLFGLNAWGFHLVSVLLHAACTALVLLVARRLPARQPGAAWVPFAAGLLFAVHPVHTEAVAWVASVPDLSFTLFFLLALVCHARVQRPFTAPHVIAAACFLLGLLCKETALTLLLVLPAWDAALGARRGGPSGVARIYAPYLLAAVIWLAARQQALAGQIPVAGDPYGLGWWHLLLSAPWLLALYFGLFLAPVGLSFWHPFEPVTSLVSVRALAGVLVGAGWAFSIALAFRRNRAIFFGLVLGVVPLLPALYVTAIPGKPFAERYLYLPSAGLILAFVLALSGLLRGRRGAAWLVLVPMLAACATATVRRNAVWRDDLTLYADTVRRSPGEVMPRYLLALALHREGRNDEAIDQYRILIGSDPGDARFQSSLGDALIVAGRLHEAVEHLDRALAADPRSKEAWSNLGTARHRLGRPAEAIEAYERAIEIDPEYAEAHYNLGAVLAGVGRSAEALDHLARAVKLRPSSAAYRNVLGIEYARQGMSSEAIEQLEEAVRLDPSEPGYRRNLERARASSGR